MFGKIFDQIFDSSIVESPETRFTFMDFIVLSDMNGVVDMTHEAIARRTNRPINIIRQTISELEGPDPRSRTPDANGARIFRLDDHRDWGWGIVNYDKFRKLASQEQRRQKTLERVRKYRVTHCNAPKRKRNDYPSVSVSVSTSSCVSLSLLKEGVRTKFEEWMEVRRGMGKAPKNWDKMFSEQAKWLSTFPESTQLETLSASIRNNWQGLFEPKSNRGKSVPAMSPAHRQNRINYLNLQKQKTNRMIKDPEHPPSWAVEELARIDSELREL